MLTEAKKAFVDVVATAERGTFTADLLRLAEQVQGAVSTRVQAGKVSPIEETRTRVTVSTARLQVQQARNLHAAAKKRLSGASTKFIAHLAPWQCRAGVAVDGAAADPRQRGVYGHSNTPWPV